MYVLQATILSSDVKGSGQVNTAVHFTFLKVKSHLLLLSKI